MNIKLEIPLFKPLSTLGKLYVDNVFYGYVVEDPPRKKKIPGITGIPFGKFDVKLTHSDKFSQRYGGIDIPEIMAPGFSGIRIHPGNTVEDTESCIMIGSDYAINKNTNTYELKDTTVLSIRLNYEIINAIKNGYNVTFRKVNSRLYKYIALIAIILIGIGIYLSI